MTAPIIVVGASHCAAQLCVSLRQGGWTDDIMVIGDENIPPYHRPPLSKDFLLGQKSIEDILIRPIEAYDTANIEMRLGTRVTQIDRLKKSVTLNTGEIAEYSKLILATGARIRKLPVPGAELDNVFYLRDSEDVEAIKSKAAKSKNVVIIGGGYIGLETAASLRKSGLNVILLEAMSRILQRVTSPELSNFFRRAHTEEGVNIFENVSASEIQSTPKGLKVMTKCGQEISADFVVIGIGVIPNVELAQEAGLDIANGISVNEFCQTTDPDIYAAGDVSWHYSPIYKKHLRLESVPNTTDQAKIVATHIFGKSEPKQTVPWFWSDQFDIKLQIAGLSEGYNDIVIRGDHKTGRTFAVFYFRGETFIAVDAVNAPQSFMMGKMAILRGQSFDKTRLANEDISLKDALSD